MIAFVNHCTTVCKGNRKKEEGSKVDLHFFPMQFFYKKRETKLKRRAQWYFVTKIVLTSCEKKVFVIEKNLWNSRLKVENLQN